MSRDPTDISIRLTFDAGTSPESSDPDVVEEGTTSPRPALKSISRASRDADDSTLDDVRRLLTSAGLRGSDEPTSAHVAAHLTWSDAPALAQTVAELVATDGTRQRLAPGVPVVIGRRPGDGGLVVSEESVSRMHCKVEVDARGQVLVTDLNASNGTWIHRGQTRIDLTSGSTVALAHDDWLRSGPEAVLAYVDLGGATD